MAIKIVKLSGVGLIALPVVAVLCVAAVYFAAKWCLANTLALNAQQKEAAEIAIDLAPDDPKGHYAAAILRERTFLTEDFQKSLNAYEKAVSLSPNDYRLWFDLAKARDRSGDTGGAEKAFRRASELAPHYSQIHWALGNLLLREGGTDEAFVEIRRAAENDAGFAAPAVAVAWNFFDADVPLISQKIGDSLPIKSALSTFLAKQQRYDEAFALWNQLSPAQKKGAYKPDGEQLLQALLGAKKYRAALDVQSQIVEQEGERFESGKIFNGGFEADVKTANASFFEWQIADALQPQIGFDTTQRHGGNRSLTMVFSSANGQDFRAVQQSVVVEGGARYTFEAFARAELKTQATLKWEIADAADGKVLASTNPVSAATEWMPLTAEFVVPRGTEAVNVRLARGACPNTICPISGKVWFDDFNFKK